MATCVNGRKGYRVCASEKCSEPAVLCRSEDCNCEDKHLNCRESLKVDLEINDLNSRLVFCNDVPNKRLEDVLQRIRALPNSIPESLKEWKAQVGLTSDQLHLLQQLAKPGQFSFSGSSVHKINTQSSQSSNKQISQLVLLHLQNIDQLLQAAQDAFHALITIGVSNPVNPNPRSYHKKNSEQPLRIVAKPERDIQDIEQLQNNLSKSKRQIIVLQTHTEKLKLELAKSKKTIDKMEYQMNQTHQIMAKKKYQCCHLEQKVKDLEQTIQLLMEQRIKNEKQGNRDYKNQIRKLQDQNKEMSRIVKQYFGRTQEQNREIQVFKLNLNKLKIENANLKEDLTQSQKKSLDKKVNSDSDLAMRVQIEHLRRSIDSLAQQRNVFGKEIQSLKGYMGMHEREKEDLNKEIKVLKIRLHESEDTITSLLMENQKLKNGRKKIEVVFQ